MGLHPSAAPWTVPNSADYEFEWSLFESPTITVSGEPEQTAMRVEVHFYITGFHHDSFTFQTVSLVNPNGEYLTIFGFPNAQGGETTIGHSAEEPLIFQDDAMTQYSNPIGPFAVFDPEVNDYVFVPGYEEPIYFRWDAPGTNFRPQEELWSSGFRGLINGEWKLIVGDNGSEYYNGEPLIIEYWALKFTLFGEPVVPGAINTGDATIGVVR